MTSEEIMKKQQYITDLKHIRETTGEIYDHQIWMKHALICDDLAAFLQRLHLSDTCLTALMDLLDEEIEYIEKDEEQQGGKQ